MLLIGVCPGGLEEGYVKWDDEHATLDQANKQVGAVPDGDYDKKHTTLKYCCSTKGDANTPISLPNTKPFYLMAYGSPQCQNVAGTRVGNFLCNVSPIYIKGRNFRGNLISRIKKKKIRGNLL